MIPSTAEQMIPTMSSIPISSYLRDMEKIQIDLMNLNYRLFLAFILSGLLFSCQSATDAFPERVDKKAETLKMEILSSKDQIRYSGTAYYVSSSKGSDENDGLSPEHPIKTLDKVSSLDLQSGDAVLFLRGDIFRGHVKTKTGCTYAAYGEGEKPRIYGSPFNAASTGSWTLTDAEHVWVYSEKLFNDVGTLVLDDAQAAMKVMMVRMEDGSTTHIETHRPFSSYRDLDRDLDFYHDYKGTGNIYLYSTKGNPADRFSSIEVLEKGNIIQAVNDVCIDNLTIMYGGAHGIGAGTVTSLEVTNCILGWIGGSIQAENLFGRNHPTRYGNAIEIYGGCGHYVVDHCWIYQAYDAGITHQYSNGGDQDIIMTDVTYSDNLVEDCVYAIEYFLGQADNDQATRYMEHILFKDNILRRSGFGWGSQRPDKETPALLKSWSHWNKASDFIVEGNIFDRCTHHLLNVAASEKEWLPHFQGNQYIQEYGALAGQMGTDNKSYVFNEDVIPLLEDLYGETQAEVTFLNPSSAQ